MSCTRFLPRRLCLLTYIYISVSRCLSWLCMYSDCVYVCVSVSWLSCLAPYMYIVMCACVDLYMYRYRYSYMAIVNFLYMHTRIIYTDASCITILVGRYTSVRLWIDVVSDLLKGICIRMVRFVRPFFSLCRYLSVLCASACQSESRNLCWPKANNQQMCATRITITENSP